MLKTVWCTEEASSYGKSAIIITVINLSTTVGYLHLDLVHIQVPHDLGVQI